MAQNKQNFPIYVILLVLTLVIQSCTKQVQEKVTIKDPTNYAKNIALAEDYLNNQEFDSAFFYYNKIKVSSDPDKDQAKIVYCSLKMAYIQQVKGDYSSSESSATEAITFFHKTTDPFYKISIYNILAINYNHLYDHNHAIYYYNKALKLSKDEIQKIIILNNIAVSYIDKNNYQKAIDILLPLTLKKEVLSDEENYARVLDNLGVAFFKTNNRKSYAYLEKSLAIRKKINDDFGITTSYLNHSKFFKNKDYTLTNEYARMAYEKATKINNVDDRLAALSLLIEGNFGTESKKFSMAYLQINDSINQERQKAKNQFSKMKYDSKKEKEENLVLKTQKIEDVLLIEQQKNKNLILYFIVGVGIAFTSFSYYFMVAKSKREKIKTSYTTEIRISKKLHDELANDVYQTIAFAETQDLSNADNREVLLTNLDAIYSRTRNISRENSSIETGALFLPHLKEMMSGFNTNAINILINGVDMIDWSAIEDTTKITVYRILQELLVNMKKHSQCSLVVLSFKKNENKLQIDYSDNGVGVAFDQINLKHGLQNVENRIQAINGKIIFDTKTGKGFKTNITVPI